MTEVSMNNNNKYTIVQSDENAFTDSENCNGKNHCSIDPMNTLHINTLTFTQKLQLQLQSSIYPLPHPHVCLLFQYGTFKLLK